MPLSDRVCFQPEPLYSKKGSHNGADKIHPDYIEVPLLFAFNKRRFSFVAGPQYSHSIQAHRKGNDTILKRNVSLPNIGVTIGSEYELNNYFFLRIRFRQSVFYSSTDVEIYLFKARIQISPK